MNIGRGAPRGTCCLATTVCADLLQAIPTAQVKHFSAKHPASPVTRPRGPKELQACFKSVIPVQADRKDGGLLTTFDLHEPHQSAYRVSHNRETNFIHVQNEFLWATCSEIGILLQLDSSAVLDTVSYCYYSS